MAAASTSRSLLGMPLRTALRTASSRHMRQPIQSRRLHSLPPLPGNFVEGKGCDPLFSSTAVKLLWSDWQGGLLNKLNDEVRGTQWENASIVETVIGAAKDPQHIQAFNYASLALNNSFFLSNLKEKELPKSVTHWEDVSPPKPPKGLLEAIENSFDSLPAFKLAFSSMAYGMSGSGFVWLVRDRDGHLGVVPTYGAGTVLIQNRTQRNAARSEWCNPSVVDVPPSSPSQGRSLPPSARLQQQQTSRAMSTSARGQFASTSPALRSSSSSHEQAEARGEELYPLLCVSVHERDWLPDYGMWGKEEYLMRFWECVDWSRVFRLYETYRGQS